jgi:hypothetical protein
LAQVAGDSNVFAFNVRRFSQDFAKNMIILQAASWIVSVALFLMTFFQITVSVQGSMREDSQELGILR